MCFIFLSNCWWIFSYLKVKQLWFFLFCFVCCLLQRFQHKICTWTINLIEITIFFVMFSITVSMKNKWKISTSLVYVLVIMDNRYNNSNIFFLCLAFSWWHKISCNLVASPKKDLKMISPIFSFQCTDFLGGFDDRFLEGVAFCCCFLRAFWREKSKPDVRTQTNRKRIFSLLTPFHMRI